MAERRIPSSRPATQPVSLKARHCRIALAVATCFTAGVLTAHAAGGNLPTGASYDPSKVASITTSGNVMTIKTLANRTVFGWDNHDIGAGYGVNYIQPTASSWVLSKVNSPDPTTIYGSLTSNGGVWLINKSGILVGNGARIDVAGFIGSTLNVTDANFLAGKLKFDATPGAGSVTIEQGAKITTPSGGSVYLVAPNVSNAGIITTPKGETILAAGETVELIDTGTPGVKVEITGAVGNATNLGEIYAEAGRIGIAGVLVKNSGTLNASSVVNEGGRVFLKASQDAYVDGNGRIVTTGTKGGSVQVLGDRVAVAGSASIDASGDFGGGEVLVGGDYQGKNSAIQNAKATYFGANASIKADARVKGNGGKVIVWADDTTRAYGAISARGGAQGGNGGFIETSGGWLDTFGIKVNATAAHGKGGTWLLDPYNLEITETDSAFGSSNVGGVGGTTSYFGAADGISKVDHTTIEGQLNNGTSVVLDTHLPNSSAVNGTDPGDILVSYSVAKTAGGEATLKLLADRNITIASGVTISSSSDKLNVILNADSHDNIDGRIFMDSGSGIYSNGGYISLVGGSSGAGFAQGNAGQAAGIYLNSTTLDSTDGSGNGGAIKIYGKADLGGASPGIGVFVAGTDIASGTGSIDINGVGGGYAISGANRGVVISNSNITSTDGYITITGTGGAGSYSDGVLINGSTTIQSYGSGVIQIWGYGSSDAGVDHSAGVAIGGPVQILSDSGQIDIKGEAQSATSGGNSNFGLVLFDDTGTPTVHSNSGSVWLRGITASDDFGLYVGAGSTVFSGGDLILEAQSQFGADSISLAGANFDGYAKLILRPVSNSTDINIGDDAPAGAFNISDADNDAISVSNNFTQVVIGKAGGAHAIKIGFGGYDANPGNIYMYGGTGGVELLTGHGMTFAPGGIVTIDGSDFTNNGTVNLNGGTFDVSGHSFVNSTSGTLNGSGDIYGDLSNAGLVYVGGHGNGLLTIHGSYSQDPTGTLKLDVAGSGQSDQLHATGSASLDGTLLLNGYGGYALGSGAEDSITILTADGGITGDFATKTIGLFGDAPPTGSSYVLGVTAQFCADGIYTACWTGDAEDNDWYNSGNWWHGHTPGASDNVKLVGSGTIYASWESEMSDHIALSKLYSSGYNFEFDGNGYNFTSSGDVTFVNAYFKLLSGTANFNGTTSLHSLYLNGGTLAGIGAVTVTDFFKQTGGSINRTDGESYGDLKITHKGIGLDEEVLPNLTYYGGTTGHLTLSAPGNTVSIQGNSDVHGTFKVENTANLELLSSVVTAQDVDVTVTGNVLIQGDWDDAGFYVKNHASIHSQGMQLNAYGGDAFISVQYGGAYINTGSGDLELNATSYDFRDAYINANGDTAGYNGYARGDIEIHTRNLVLDGSEGYAYINANLGDVKLYANDVSLTTHVGESYGNGSAYIRAYQGDVNIDATGAITLDARAGGDAYLYAYGGNVLIGHGDTGVGSVTLQSGYGSAYISAEFDQYGSQQGGNIVIASAGDVTLDGRLGTSYNHSAKIVSYGGDITIGAGGAVNVYADGGEGFILGYGSLLTRANVDIRAASVNLQGGSEQAWIGTYAAYTYYWDSELGQYVYVDGNGGDVAIKTTGNVSLDRADIWVESGLASITAGGSVALDNGAYIQTNYYGSYGGDINSSVLIAAGTDVTLRNNSYIQASNWYAPPNVEILVDQGSIKLESGSYIRAGNDVKLTLNGIKSTLELGLNDPPSGEIQVLSEGPGGYSYILSDTETGVPATTVITFTKVSKDGILINGTPTDLKSAGAEWGTGAGFFVATERGYQPAYVYNGVELHWGTPDDPVLRIVGNTITDFFNNLNSATDVQGDAVAKKKKLESEKQGSDQNGESNGSNNSCS